MQKNDQASDTSPIRAVVIIKNEIPSLPHSSSPRKLHAFHFLHNAHPILSCLHSIPTVTSKLNINTSHLFSPSLLQCILYLPVSIGTHFYCSTHYFYTANSQQTEQIVMLWMLLVAPTQSSCLLAHHLSSLESGMFLLPSCFMKSERRQLIRLIW